MKNESEQSLLPYWFPMCCSEVLTGEKPQGFDFLGNKIVIWRTKDSIHAWRDYCPHRGSRLSLGRIHNGRLSCGYHGWEFDESGTCVCIPVEKDARIPERARIETMYKAVEQGGLIWINLGNKSYALPSLPQYSDSDYRVMAAGPYEIETSMGRMCENFLDSSHIPFVHEGTIGVPDYPEVPRFETTEINGLPAVSNVQVFSTVSGESGNAAPIYFDYRVLSPAAVYFEARWTENEPDANHVLMLAVRPVHEEKSYVFFSSALRDVKDRETHVNKLNSSVSVLMQDKPIVESQQPKRLPINPREEIHLPSDAMTVAWRRYLRNINFTYGTITD